MTTRNTSTIKIIALILAIVLIILGIIGGFFFFSKRKQPQPQEQKPVVEDKVCCEFFGYGDDMKKCCEKYEWKPAKECSVAEGFTGGGKNMVSDSKCEEDIK